MTEEGLVYTDKIDYPSQLMVFLPELYCVQKKDNRLQRCWHIVVYTEKILKLFELDIP